MCHPRCVGDLQPSTCVQIQESEWDSIKASVLAICASSSRSSKPAIYGLAAEAEIRRLRPLSSMGQLEVGDSWNRDLMAAVGAGMIR